LAGIDLDGYRVLLDDNVVTQREAKAGPFARRLDGKERIEYFLFCPRRNAATIVTNQDFDVVVNRRGVSTPIGELSY
jgi:hypothetical protein